MAKILFVNPVVREEDVPRHIPYGMAMLAQIARERKHLVQIYDANAWRQEIEVLDEIIKADQWDAICIGGLTTTYGFIKEACIRFKRWSPESLVIAGGGFFTSMPREILSWVPEIDIGVLGEVYVTFPELLDLLDAGSTDWEGLLGVAYRNEKGTIVVNKERPNIKDLDSLPWPAFDLFPLEEVYFKNSSSLYSEEAYYAKRRVDINGSLGCSLVCKFCWHLGITGDLVVEENKNGEADVQFTYGRNIRYHSPNYIIEMVKHLRQEYSIDHVSFLDENMMTMDAYSKRTWLSELCTKWIENGLQPTCRKLGVSVHEVENEGVFWSGTSHATLHRKEILELMYEAGCSHLVYGLESFDRDILKDLGKGSTPQKNEDAVQICLESGITPIPNIIIGFPDESFESIGSTIKSLIKMGIHAKPHFATAYPGSEWYYKYKDSIQAQYNGDLEQYILDLGDASKITATISHNFSAMELLGLQEIVAKRDLRLLTLSEDAWRGRNGESNALVQPNPIDNFLPSKKATPIYSDSP